MSSQLAEVAARIATTRQLEAIIGAMRAIAASRVQEARQQLEGIRAYAATVGQAIGQALALLPAGAAPPTAPADGALTVALCAEEGFAGAFSETVLESAWPARGAGTGRLYVVGDRGLMAARSRGREPDWYAPMALRPEQVGELATQLGDALARALLAGHTHRVRLVHAAPAAAGPPQVLRRMLVPFDYRRFPATDAPPARLTLAPDRLVAQLVDEYVYAELCEALMLSLAGENQARMEAMIAAHANIGRRRKALTAQYHRTRQEEITSEIIELAGAAAGR